MKTKKVDLDTIEDVNSAIVRIEQKLIYMTEEESDDWALYDSYMERLDDLYDRLEQLERSSHLKLVKE